jgi:YegS/Rv2252/BmrU family lipid kinase
LGLNNYVSLITAYDTFGETGENGDEDYIAAALIHGKPVLNWVIDSVRRVTAVKKIIVAGPQSIDAMACTRNIDIRLQPVLFRIHEQIPFPLERELLNTITPGTDGILLMPCGLLYLQPHDIESFIDIFEKNNSEISFLSHETGHAPDDDKSITLHLTNGTSLAIHSNVGFARNTEAIGKHLRFYRFLDSAKKSISASSAGDLENKISELYKVKTGLIRVKKPGILRIITTTKDIPVAEAALPDPWHHRFSNVKIVLNPHSGAEKPLTRLLNKFFGYNHSASDYTISAEEQSEYILNTLKRFKIEAQVVSLQDIRSLSGSLINWNKPDLIIAAGGDGTINSVINVLAYSGIPLGIIPLGTSNVFSIELNIPPGIHSACQLIAQSEVRYIDLGKINDRFFSCIAGIGIDAYVSRHVETQSGLKRILGGIAFLVIGFFDFFRYRFRPISLKVDDQPIPRSGYLVVTANGKHYGGELVFAPSASLNDGLLDVVIFKSKNIISILRYLFGFLQGKLPDLETVEYLQAKRIEISGKGHHNVHIDGEYFGHTPVKIEAAPKALGVLY